MKNILIVDDDKTNLVSAKAALDGQYRAIGVTSGTQALNFLERNVCDLILLDVEMPEMDGMEVLKQIRTKDNGKTVPVIFLTANKRRETVMEGAKLGIVDYITKPFEHRFLQERVEAAIRQGERETVKADLYEPVTEVLEDLKAGRISNAIRRVEEILLYLKA